MCLLPMLMMAQTKKVAILETVDKEGKISYAHKLMLRSSLAKAITEADGYEGYDRVDLESVLGEHSFQRTGMVSDDQIKKLGEMVGAQYVLIAEAVMVDDATMFITAKIIDVETAQTMKTESQLMKATPQDIQIGCTTMAGNMLGIKLNAGITQSAASSKPASSSTSSSTPTPVSTPKPAAPATKINWDGYDQMSFRVSKCSVSGSRLTLVIIVTNNTKEYIRAQFERQPNLGTYNLLIYDDAGNSYNLYKIGGKIGDSNMNEYSTYFEMPSSTSMKMTFWVNNFDEDATKITAFTCSFRGMSEMVYGKASLEIKNIPVSRQ